MTDERDVLLSIIDTVAKYVPEIDRLGGDARNQIREIPDKELPATRAAILEGRDMIRKSVDLRDGVLDVVRMACKAAKITGFQAGFYIGSARSWAEDQENWPVLGLIVNDTLAIVDRAYP